jgi:micrococcal nuclease
MDWRIGVLALLLVTAGCVGFSSTTNTETQISPQVTTATSTPAMTAVPDSPSPADTMVPTTAPAGTATTLSDSPSPTQTPTLTPTATGTPTATPTLTPTPTSTATPADGLRVTVTQVVDGDTIDIEFQNGTSDTVRLLGVDTPEVHVETDPAEWEGVPSSQAGRDCLREEGYDASDYVSNQIAGETVTIQFDDAADRRGSYGRLLAYVIVDGENLNYQLVNQGYARVYDSTFSLSESFYTAESSARSAESGAWRCQNAATPTATPTPTSTSTETATPSGDDGELVVDEIHADAEGNDHENLNDEYVVFRNAGDEPIEMGGWQVEDEADHTYTVPSGFTLEPGETVTLYTGSGDNTDDERRYDLRLRRRR